MCHTHWLLYPARYDFWPWLYKERTELLWVGSRYNLSALEGCGPALRLDADTVEAKDHVRVLGVTFWVDLTLDRHVSNISAACFYRLRAESGGHSIPGQRRHSSTPSWRRALITATLYLPSHRRPQPTSSNECLTLLPALSRARRNTTADWHESCATSFIVSVCRSGSSSSSAPWCTAVYTTLLPGTYLSTLNVVPMKCRPNCCLCVNLI